MKYLIALLSLFLIEDSIAQTPDIILYNGKVFTADKKQLYVAALAVRGDKIVAVGTDEKIKSLGDF